MKMNQRMRTGVAWVLCGLLVTMSTGLGAQQVIDQEGLDRLIEQSLSEQEAQRAAIERVLDHPEVRQVAGRLGIDASLIRDGVATLEGAELAEIAVQAGDVDRSLSGGQSTITMTTTTLIIILLVAILVVVAVN